MSRLTIQKRIQIISALVEGNAINATARMTGVSKVTILKLLKDVGEACTEFENKTLRNLTCKRIQCDEIWNFCYAKGKKMFLKTRKASVELGKERYPVRRTPKSGLRQVDFVHEGNEIRGLEQLLKRRLTSVALRS